MESEEFEMHLAEVLPGVWEVRVIRNERGGEILLCPPLMACRSNVSSQLLCE